MLGIKFLEEISQIKAHTIRVWEQRYAILKPHRTDTNIRTYTNNDLKILLNVALLNKYGFKISRIGKMSDAEIKQAVISLTQEDAIQERLVNQLVEQMIDLEMENFSRIINDHINANGIDQTIMQLIYPFLEKSGIFWQTPQIPPEQEHLVRNIIRQKLVVALGSIPLPSKPGQTFLLFLPRGEYHEPGLLFAQFLIRKKGFNTLYLGTNVPIGDIKFVVKVKQPHYVYTQLGSARDLKAFLPEIHLHLRNIPTLITGSPKGSIPRKLPDNVSFMSGYPALIEFLDALADPDQL